jgi:hypothetical protein
MSRVPMVSLLTRRIDRHLPLDNSECCSLYPSPHANLSDTASTETNSKIHRQFRNAHEGHRSHAGLDPTRASTGVVWCTERAYEHGFAEEPEKWANLGQGAPEVEDGIEGSFNRPTEINISMAGREYGPTAGIKSLRAAVANLYNVHHRKGKSSLYSWENVCIVPGGRAGLIRIAAVLNNAYLGFFIPDYTAYNEMLSLFKNVSPLSKLEAGEEKADERWDSLQQSPHPSQSPMVITSTLTKSRRRLRVELL